MKSFLFASAIALAASTIFVAPIASAQDAYDVDTDAPPPEVIATVSPVYFGGHASYWWNGGWHFRDAHGGWNHYRGEPTYLHTWRGSHPVAARHYYTTGRPSPVVIRRR
jgi:hypothetical protein